MSQTFAIHQRLRSCIEADLAARVKAHQAAIARLRVGRANLAAAGAVAPVKPLVMLALGDSWFDYPLSGNGAFAGNTDIVAQLARMGDVNPEILNLAHYAEANPAEFGLPKLERLIQALREPANWFDPGKPDAILFSGGGEGIAGERFCTFLGDAAPGAGALNNSRLARALEMAEVAFLDLLALRNRYAPEVPVVAHCYDFPLPNGSHPPCAGPWLKPALDYCGFNQMQGSAILRQVLGQFKNMLTILASKPANNLVLVDTQGTLAPADWANELHPYAYGFQALAGRFVNALRARFPGRI